MRERKTDDSVWDFDGGASRPPARGLGQRLGAILVCAALAPSALAGSVHYVYAQSPGPTHDGRTWCSAVLDLQTALDRAFFGDEIRVAQGVYRPSSAGLSDARDATFALSAGVTLRGGYAGCGALLPDLRHPANFRTVLSGDLAGDDAATGNTGDNAYHVVTAINLDVDTVLDGFEIRAGHADGDGFPAGRGVGGGVYSIGNLTVRDCTFVDNFAQVGGGFYSLEGSPVIERCRLLDNRAERGAGMTLYGFNFFASLPDGSGGSASLRHGTPRVVDALFEANEATGSAGALWVNGIAENPTLTHCIFRNNLAGDDAGAVFCGGGFTILEN